MLWNVLGCWNLIFHHSAKKLTSACDLIAVLGLKLISKAPSSTAHFEIHLVFGTEPQFPSSRVPRHQVNPLILFHSLSRQFPAWKPQNTAAMAAASL